MLSTSRLLRKLVVLDGNTAAVHVAYGLSEQAFIYPISPSTPMCELAAQWAAEGRRNVFGSPVKVTQMQSEGGAAGALHGVLDSGGLASTFTCSQGLLLMIPNMYIIAGQLSPCVFHVTARALSKQGLSIYAEHTDVMAVRQTGWGMIASSSVQEAMDISAVAHLTSLHTSIPFVHFFDGYRTSHEINKIEMVDYASLAELVPMDKLAAFRSRGLTPTAPHARACNTGSDAFFQGSEAVNMFYDKTPAHVKSVLSEMGRMTGRHYSLFDYFGPASPEHVIVTMGSSTSTVREVVASRMAYDGKHGSLNVRLLRPWSAIDFIQSLPNSVKRVTVLDRTKDAAAIGEPLFLDVAATLQLSGKAVQLLGGRYGLGSREFGPSEVNSVLDNADREHPQVKFTVGVNDDVTRLSLPVSMKVDDRLSDDTKECVFYAMGSDGTVSANKNAIKLIGDHTDLYVQGYIWNDSKKAGGATVSHLRFGPSQINQPYEIISADFLAISEPTWPAKFPKAMLKRLRPNGIVLLNTNLTTAEALANTLPAAFLSGLAQKNAQLWVLDAVKVATENGLGKHINNCMQSAFFKLSQVLPFETEALPLLLQSFEKAYSKRGPELVKKNQDAAIAAISALRQIPVPAEWALLHAQEPSTSDGFFDTVSAKLAMLEGESLPVSAFDPHGRYPTGMTKFEKRGIAASIPVVDMEKCTQCNLCSIICPHAAIRPFLLDPVETVNAPFTSKPAVGGALTQGYNYRIQVTPLDCTGCAACAFTCADDALTMVPLTPPVTAEEKNNWNFAITVPERAGRGNPKRSARESQLALPMLEFSGACAGCGETPYAKLVTQLFGERMLIANASGCSGVWGAAAGFSAYTTNSKGEGPAWGRSLYEDAAEYGLGLATASQSRRNILKDKVIALLDEELSPELRALLWRWVNGGMDDPVFSQQASRLVPDLLSREKNTSQALLEVRGLQQEFIKLSPWIFGGDGWAYDIGFGGLDHVLASGTNLNVLVLDTEGYANTGGQKSKATQLGAVQKFASDGYRRAKKSLAEMAMSYEDVYVATIAVGADPGQSVRALLEADAYNGPSLVLCYSPCIEHKIKTGLSRLSEEMRLAVQSGYWPLFRYHPGSGFTLDAPRKLSLPVSSFTDLEDRFGTLSRQQPQVAAALATQLQEFVTHHHAKLVARAGASNHSDAKVRILFAGATGNSAELASRLKTILDSRGCTASLDECDSSLQVSTPVLFCVSTVGDGEMPSAAATMVDSLPTSLTGLEYAIFGLGDRSYRSFCGAAKHLDAALQERGARRICELGFGDDQDEDKYETGFAKWTPLIVEALNLPTASSTAPLSPFRVDTVGTSPPGLILNLTPPAGFFNLTITSSKSVGSDPLALRVISLAETNDSIGDLSYKVGDALSVLPRNDPVRVGDFLSKLGLDPVVAVKVSTAQRQTGSDARKVAMLTGGAVQLKDIFEQVLDLFGRPTAHFIQQLESLTSTKFTGDAGTFASVITSHSVVVNDVSSLLALLPVMKPRLYSIASSLRHSPKGTVDLLVVRADGGLCSNYLNTIQLGSTVIAAVSASTFHIPPVSQPVVMAALGTGVAPFRAVLAERAAASAAREAVGPALLFYGCRSLEDFAFAQEFAALEKSGLLKLRPAFSRSGVPKGYIQSQMNLMASEIHQMVNSGTFLLCGKAGAPAQAVEAALHAALQEGGGLSREEAVEFVTALKETRRFSEEVY